MLKYFYIEKLNLFEMNTRLASVNTRMKKSLKLLPLRQMISNSNYGKSYKFN